MISAALASIELHKVQGDKLRSQLPAGIEIEGIYFEDKIAYEANNNFILMSDSEEDIFKSVRTAVDYFHIHKYSLCNFIFY